jgi:hypothetical protein
MFYVLGFGAEDYTVNHNNTYSAKDQDQNSAQELKAFVMSSVIYHRRTTLYYNVWYSLSDHLWNFFSQTPEILGLNYLLQSFELMYNTVLLLDLSEFIFKY